MKTAFTFILCFIKIVCFSQTANNNVVSISKGEFSKHLLPRYPVVKSSAQKKLRGVIKIKTAAKTIVLKDDGEFLQYTYEGSISGTPLGVIHAIEPNSEEYYLINTTTAVVDTLVSKPNFYKTNAQFVCFRRAESDMPQALEIGRITINGIVKKRIVNLNKNINQIYWHSEKTLLLAAANDKYYKLAL